MHTILIANRGEIACRIARSCRRLGLRSVAVFSEADAGALHTTLTDQAIAIGPAAARESYLDVERILAAARESGADAVHPGYGFLAESASFARAIEAAGMTWIGPRPESIEAMGRKDRAREIARAAGVPVIPGSDTFADGELDNLDDAIGAVGFPCLVKAVAGGGGIGMQIAETAETLRATMGKTQALAARFFGDGSIYLERYVPRGRHVEVQVFGDGQGQAIHFNERDCSLQRRYQKIIEETPAPKLPAATRDAMAASAVSLACETRYLGAGTVEFLVDVDSGHFYFLEMNTRIQVEHPVTEVVTGADLVAMQIDLARGVAPTMEQAAVRAHGHAIECRVYAENPAKMFMPSPGTLERMTLPAPSDTVRVDTAYREGDEVTVHYDPMLVKIIGSGVNRASAIAATRAALAATCIEGIRTNLAFLDACLAHEAFAAGDVFTGFVDTHHKALTK
jgi:3-methylcrotonyl-CoA carboxylase alpha subunit